MKQYPELLEEVYKKGEPKNNIQGIGDVALFARTLRFKVIEEFPLTPTRKIPLRLAVGELLWMLKGDTTLAGLHEYGVHWWDNYATPEIQEKYNLSPGNLGRVYGAQIRGFNGGGEKPVDQLLTVQDSLKNHPEWRRHVITLWNPSEVDQVYYAPCITELKFFSAQEKLSLAVVQRSADVPGGVPFDMAEMGTFLHMMAQVTNHIPHELVYFPEDCHVYDDQKPQVEELMRREVRPLPRASLSRKTQDFTDIRQFFDLKPEDIININNYNPHPALRIPVSSR